MYTGDTGGTHNVVEEAKVNKQWYSVYRCYRWYTQCSGGGKG